MEEGYRRAIVAHLTSWVQNNTGVVTDPNTLDSESLEHALNEVNGVVFEIEGETYRKPLGLEAEQLLVAAELVMRRAVHYASRGEWPSERGCVQTAKTMLDEAGWYFADEAKECTECERSHHSAGILCPSCRKPFQENMPAGCRWFITYEDDVWHLRNGEGHNTLIFAYNAEIDSAGDMEAKRWAAGVLRADYGLTVADWSPSWEGQTATLTPDCWIAATNTDEDAQNREARESHDTRWSLAYGDVGAGEVLGWAVRIGEGSTAIVQAINVTLEQEDLDEAQRWAAGLLAEKLTLAVVAWEPAGGEPDTESGEWLAVMQTD